MSKIVDARGLACPQAVILTRKALQESDAVTTIVDNETAKSNVSRLAAKKGCQVDVEERVEPLPQTIIFFNSGVKLVVEGSPVVEDLQALEAQGIEVLACGTCLGHYGLKERVAVGEVSNMYTIAEMMLGAGKVVSL